MTAFHPAALAAELVRRYALTAADLVVEVGSGDGQLPRAVRVLGPRAIGVEPEPGVSARAWAAGVDTVAASFGPEAADHIRRRYGPARVVVVESGRVVELTAFVATAAHCLAPDGVIVVHSGAADRLVEVRPGFQPLPAVSRAA